LYESPLKMSSRHFKAREVLLSKTLSSSFELVSSMFHAGACITATSIMFGVQICVQPWVAPLKSLSRACMGRFFYRYMVLGPFPASRGIFSA
jgi:xylose isomerase